MELFSGLNEFFPNASVIFLNKKALHATNEIQMSANLKKLPKSLQKGETPIDLKIFYSGEDQDFKNRVEIQGLDRDAEKFSDFLSIPK